MTISIPLPTDEQLTVSTRKILDSVPPANLFRMMANAPTSLKPFIELASSILFQSEFDARRRELAILRIAHLTQAPYEWAQHVRIAELVGVTPDEINRLACDAEVTGFDADDQLTLHVATEITSQIRLSDDTLQACLQRFGQRQTTELILCCAYFNMLSRFLESTRVMLEDQPLL